MKNLTRVLALVLTFAMMISTVAMAATFTDIEAGSTYAEATAVLADLGILKGYEDGTFGADKVITRAEVVAVVNRLQGLSDAAKAAGGATQYTDVPATEWFAGDVNLATQMGIISGDGNGLFRPNDQVKYEEAVKMVVAALGYNQDYVLKRGGWPTGYLVIATEAEISKGVAAGAGEPAYRGIVAKLAYNALTAPTFAFDSYSTSGEAIYSVNSSKIILEEKLQVSKLTGYVIANAVTVVDGSVVENDEVGFKITENKVGKYSDEWSITKTQAVAGGGNVVVTNPINTKFVTATDVAATVAQTTDIYVKKNLEGENEIISYTLNNLKNKVITIEEPKYIQSAGVYASEFEGAADAADVDTTIDNYISVYNEEVDSTNTVYQLETDAKLIVNGGYEGAIAGKINDNMKTIAYSGNVPGTSAELGKIYAPAYGKVELLDNNNDGEAEFVFVTAYEIAVVDDVIDTADSKKIFTKNSGTIDLINHAEGKKGFAYSLTLDGEEAAIADLQENDVIAVAVTNGNRGYDIMATRKTVNGLVSETDKPYDTTVTPNVPTYKDWVFVVDGTEYAISNLSAKSYAAVDSIGAGDEVTFYLDAFGNIAYADRTSTTAKNYGFIVGVGETNSIGDTTYQVQLLDKEGNLTTYDLADNVRFANVGGNGTTAPTVASSVYTNLRALAFDNANNADTVNANLVSDWIIKLDQTNPGAPVPAYENITTAMIANYAKRMITFRTNANGQITEIVRYSAYAPAPNTGKEGYLTLDLAAVGSKQYNAKTQSFIGGASVSEDTVVFNLPIMKDAARDKFEVATIDSLTHEETYDIAVLSVDENNVAGAILVVDNAATVAKGSNLAVVTKVMAAQNADLAPIFNITFLQNGEEKTLPTTDIVAGYAASMAVGQVFEYSVDDEGVIDAIALGTTPDINPVSYAALRGFATNPVHAEFLFNGAKEQFVFGVVYGKTNSRVIAIANNSAPAAANNSGAKYTHAIPAEANVYMIDLTGTKVKVSVSAFSEIREFKADPNTNTVIQDNDFAVFMKYFNDEITDVVAIKGYITKGLGY